MAGGPSLVDKALQAFVAAALIDDDRHWREANAYLDDDEVCRALEEAGFAEVDYDNESVELTPAGDAMLEEISSEMGDAERRMRGELDYTGSPAYRIEFAFRFVELTCTRTLVVPAHATFENLHTMLQAAMGWMNYHPYDFYLVRGGQEYCVSWPDYETGGDPKEMYAIAGDESPTWVNSAIAYLDEWLPDDGRLLYLYDFGDGWEMELAIAGEVTMAGPDPVCLSGEGDAPPEDVGGEGGLQRFLSIIANKDDPEYDHMLAWGLEQGFEHFDLESINERLGEWGSYRRMDAHTMSFEAQFKAFGAIVFLPPYVDEEEGLTEEERRSRSILRSFERALSKARLEPAEEGRHQACADFFLSRFLAYREEDRFEDPFGLAEEYFGRWLPQEISNMDEDHLWFICASITLLFDHMAEMGWMDLDSWEDLYAYMRRRIPVWLKAYGDAPDAR